MKKYLMFPFVPVFFLLTISCTANVPNLKENRILGPATVARLWNDSLYSGDIGTSKKYTSIKSEEYVRKAFGSLENLSEDYYKPLLPNRPKCKNRKVNISGNTALVTYTCSYKDGSMKQWTDTLFFEKGIWKLSPMHVKSTLIKRKQN